jgi:hypothetical protein
VRNIVAAWKDRSPAGARPKPGARAPASVVSSQASLEEPSLTGTGDGLFSLRRRAERGSMRLRDRASVASRDSFETPRRASGPSEGEGALLPPPFDITELGGGVRGSQEVTQPLLLPRAKC